MPARRGGTPLVDIRRGSSLINQVRRGSTIVWSRSTVVGGLIPVGGLVRDDFNRDNADTLGTAWTSHGPSGDKLIGIENSFARLKLDDVVIGGFWSFRTSRVRYNAATLSSDDGYVECRMSTRGNGVTVDGITSIVGLVGYRSQLFGRLSNAAFTHGVGIHMSAGHVWIVRRVNNVEALMADGGTFQAGDVLRLTFVGNLHTLSRNGTQVAQWNDTGSSASRGATFRSMGIVGEGAKELLGPRRFSPAFDYVEVGG